MMKLLLLAAVIVAAFLMGKAQAADPLTLQITDAQVFRHVLETDDWLVLGRLYKAPDSSTGNTDSFTVTTTSGAFDDPIVLTNRVIHTPGTDYTVTETGVPTDLTSFCTLGQDDTTISCAGTGLADASYTIEVEYRMGWDAYQSSEVFVRLVEADPATILAERSSPNGTYTLAGLYLTSSDVATLGITWGDSDILLNALASPNLWDTPADVAAVIMWDSSADADATETALTAELQQYLVELEQADPAVSSGYYVTPAGITLAGAVVATRAFSLIQTAVPRAFVSYEVNPFPTAVATASRSLVVAIETQVANTTTFINFQAVHPASGGLFTFIISVAVAAGLWVQTRSMPVVGGAWWVVITAGWLIFALPFQLVFITMAGIIALGFMWVGKAVYE